MDDLYDLVIANGRVIDPGNDLDGLFDVAVRNGKVAAVQPKGARFEAKETYDATGMVVTPGLIDIHGVTPKPESLHVRCL